MTDQIRFNNTIASFNAINALDPNQININGKQRPKELVYAERLSEMLNRYAPEASEALRLAVCAQHIQRWISPRSDYPLTKPGYMHWRNNLKNHHAEVASNVMQQQGYDAKTIRQVASLLKKENLHTNADTQTLEDVIVLAFLEHDLADFVEKYSDYPEEKLFTILRKSYLKMSEAGRAAALNIIHVPEHLLPVVVKAVTT
jgi:uncharacterized protein (UPF0335 family)